MSTFPGQIADLPGISIDRFDQENLNSKLFFLSHCHTDHMRGLNNHLPGPLYVSSVSGILIRKMYPEIIVKELTIGEPYAIFLSDSTVDRRCVIVTALPAGHCPGSVMFLFENDNKKILYTGDFRLKSNHFEKMRALRDSNNQLIKLDTVYLDSTFFLKRYRKFPTQFESIDRICDIMRDWIRENPEKHQIRLQTSARYGYEYLFQQINERLNEPIHINETECEQYKFLPEMDNCFRIDGNQCRIHCCYERNFNYNKNSSIPCQQRTPPEHILCIKLSAMLWTDWDSGHDIHTRQSDNRYQICYSNHSSYEEICDILIYLRPERVEFNVEQSNLNDNEEMEENLKEIYSKINRTDGNLIFRERSVDYRSKKSDIPVFTTEQTMNDDDDETINFTFVKRRKI